VRAALLARAALPVRMGGLGVADRSRVAAAAVVASSTDAAVHCHRAAAPALADLAEGHRRGRSCGACRRPR